MVILEKSDRIKNIEQKFNASIKDLFYQMHWVEDMRHRDIALILNTPRCTVTRWFHHFQVPTQSCRSFTDKNLTSWLYKTGRLKKKPRYHGPDRRIQRTKGGLNVDFFKKWSDAMAYVLGYFAADGCMYKNSGGSKYFNFVSTDYELLGKIKRILGSKHRIVSKTQSNPNCKPTFWFQIGCKEMYNDIIKLGLIPKKEFRLELPKVPSEFFRDFVRGYFDGDGCVSYSSYKRRNRRSRVLVLITRFASSSKKLLCNLKRRLESEGNLDGGFIFKGTGCFYLTYSKEDSAKLFKYMYQGSVSDYYLERKYNKFREAFKAIGPVV